MSATREGLWHRTEWDTRRTGRSETLPLSFFFKMRAAAKSENCCWTLLSWIATGMTVLYAEPMQKLARTAIVESLKSAPLWTRKGQQISRTFEFADFIVSIKFVNAVAKAAEKAGHHPDIDVRWNKVTLHLTTHDAGGLTAKDFKLALEFDVLASSVKSLRK